MTPEQFAYWLQGFAEVVDREPDEREWKIIRDHLSSVFHKVTPDRSKKKADENVTAEETIRRWQRPGTIC